MLNRPLLKYDKFINMLKGIFGNGQRTTDNRQQTTVNGQQVWAANNFTNPPLRTYVPWCVAGSAMHNYIYNVDV